MADDTILVEGLSEFRKGLRDASRELPRVLTKAHRTVAVLVVAKARPTMTTRHGHTPPSAKTLRASGTQSGAFVKVSGPTAFGDEFGGGARPRTRQFKPHHGRQGYAIYPAIRDSRATIETVYVATVLGEIEKRAFPD